MIARVRSSLQHDWAALPGIAMAVLMLSLPNLLNSFWPVLNPVQAECVWLGMGLILLPCVFSVPVRLALMVWVPFAALVPAAVIYTLVSGAVLREWAFIVLMETNAAELERFQYVAVGAIGLAFPAAWGYWRFISRQVAANHRLGWLSRVAVVVLTVLPLATTLTRNGWRLGGEAVQVRLSGTFPVGPAVGLVRAFQIRQGLEDRHRVALDVEVTPQRGTVPEQRELYVLVIGESARFSSFQLNGYQRETNPLLMKTDGLISFQDVIAPATVTLMSVPLLLTPARAPWLGKASGLPSVISVFKRAGYHTAWYSTQRKHGRFDTASSLFAKDADDSRFLSGVFAPGTGDYTSVYDGALIQPVRELITQGGQRQFIVLHTMGSHQHYSDRYPAEFNHFDSYPALCRGNLLAGGFDPEQIRNLTNAYDNTIRYTDWVLSQLIDTLAATGAVSALYYIADHGQNQGDARVLPFAHGNPSHDVVHVPMMVWLSPAFQHVRPEQTRALKAHVSTPFSGDSTFHTLVDMAGLDTPLLDRQRSVASEHFLPGPRLLRDLQGKVVNFEEMR